MAMRMSERAYQQLLAQREQARGQAKRPTKQAPSARLQPGSGHAWKPEGTGLRCTGCQMWLSRWAWPAWHRGYYDPAGAGDRINP